MKIVQVIDTDKSYLVESGLIDFNLTSLGLTFDQFHRGQTDHKVRQFTPAECDLTFKESQSSWFANIEGKEVALINMLGHSLGGIVAQGMRTVKSLAKSHKRAKEKVVKLGYTGLADLYNRGTDKHKKLVKKSL